MKRSILLTGYACLCGWLMFPFLCLEAQERKFPTRTEMETELHPVPLEQGASILRFDTCRLSVGTMKEEDSPRKVCFTFRNVSTKEVRLTRVNTTCGCTAAAFPTHVLQPGESGEVCLTFHPKNKVGTVDAEAFVYTDAHAKRPVARLSLAGEVTSDDQWRHLPQSMGVLRLNRKRVVCVLRSSSSKATERILCANSGSHPLRLSSKLLPSYASFRTEPSVIAPGSEADLVITIDVGKLPRQAGRELSFSLLVDGVEGRPSERMLEVVVKR